MSPVDTERPVAWTLIEVGVSFVDGAFDTQLGGIRDMEDSGVQMKIIGRS